MMTKLPKSLHIALWFTATMWFVGILGYFSGQGTELLIVVGFMGLIAAFMEMRELS